MKDYHLKTLNDANNKLDSLEREVKRHKMFINSLYEIAGEQPIYRDLDVERNENMPTIQGDQFYKQPLAKAVRMILEMRKKINLSTATHDEIFIELNKGGYDFEGKKDELAKRNIAISISKNPIFCKLPNGHIGLSNWYPHLKKDKEKLRADHDDFWKEDENEEMDKSVTTDETQSDENSQDNLQ